MFKLGYAHANVANLLHEDINTLLMNQLKNPLMLWSVAMGISPLHLVHFQLIKKIETPADTQL